LIIQDIIGCRLTILPSPRIFYFNFILNSSELLSANTFIEKLKAGDKDLLRGLYKDYLDRVVYWISTNNGNQEDGYDIFHDTLEALINKSFSQEQNFNQNNIGSYIMQIAKNKWIDQLRRKKTFQKVRKSITERLDSEYNIEEDYISVETEHIRQQALQEAFGKLSDVCQKLLSLIIQERKTDEIVKALDMSNANTMYRRKHACLQSWKTNIEATDYTHE
jgi:RNA polymerase sigma factor (sigma-70 family)